MLNCRVLGGAFSRSCGAVGQIKGTRNICGLALLLIKEERMNRKRRENVERNSEFS